jgi:hypothetical protein
MARRRRFIKGDPYPLKEQLKPLGCRWDGDRFQWYAETEEVAAALRRWWEAAVEGLTECSVMPEGLIRTEDRIRLAEGETCSKVVLPDGRTGWRCFVRVYGECYSYSYLPADVARAVCLAQAAERGITPEGAAEWLARHTECHGADVYRAVVEADEATQEALRVAAARKHEADLKTCPVLERLQLERAVQHQLENLGLLEPELGDEEYGSWARDRWFAEEHRFIPELLASWKFRPGPGFEAFIAAWVVWTDPAPTLEGAEVVLRLAPAAFAKGPGSQEPSPAEAMPEALKIFSYCTVRVVIERA